MTDSIPTPSLRQVRGRLAAIAAERQQAETGAVQGGTPIIDARGTITRHALRGHLASLILTALERGEAHGFEIQRRLEAAGSGALRLKEGSLYPALYRLEGAGLVRGEWEDGAVERRGPRRRIYRLTSKGAERLTAARSQWRQFVQTIGGILGAPA